VAAWVAVGGRHVDLAVIALLGATALFVFRVLTWEKAERHIYWNIILMYGGAIALGAALDRTGAARWLLAGLLDGVHLTPYLTIVGTAILALLLSEVMSNAAALAVILPLAFTLANQSGASPVALVLATSFGAGLDFIFPMSTAPNTIIFASGFLRTSDFVKAGTLMTATSIAILLFVVRFWWPLLGLV
jgi:solute carrier family 13 (sodium-dependent dicarboxylate transporter), member 2/3/5